MKYIVNDDVVLSHPLEGPLSAHIAGLRSGHVMRDTRYLPGIGKFWLRRVLAVGLVSKP